jgi:hypothetical protein
VISEWGLIDFNSLEFEKLANLESLAYDEYLEAMKNSGNNARQNFLQFKIASGG